MAVRSRVATRCCGSGQSVSGRGLEFVGRCHTVVNDAAIRLYVSPRWAGVRRRRVRPIAPPRRLLRVGGHTERLLPRQFGPFASSASPRWERKRELRRARDRRRSTEPATDVVSQRPAVRAGFDELHARRLADRGRVANRRPASPRIPRARAGRRRLFRRHCAGRWP